MAVNHLSKSMFSLATPLSAAAAARALCLPAEAAPPSALQRFPLLCANQELWRLRLWGCSLPAMSPSLGGMKSRRNLPHLRAMDMSSGQSNDPGKLSIDSVVETLKDLWVRCPEPVRSFPWMGASRHFVDLVFDVVFTVVKYLCIPVLLVSSLSEISYCAHERKMLAIPLPFLFGIAVARTMEETVLDISPAFKEMEFPWHLVLLAGFFMLVKLPGPYYPYIGRLVLPHFANGGLWSTIFSVFFWFRRFHGQITEK